VSIQERSLGNGIQQQNQGARTTFRTKLDGPATHNTAGSQSSIYDIWQHKLLRAAIIVPIKLQAISLAGASLSSCPRLYTLRFSFAIYLFPHISKQPNLDSFHMLSTNHLQLSLHLYYGIKLSVLETSNLLRYLAAWLYRSLQSVHNGPASIDE
jgi:hypothetical protein